MSGETRGWLTPAQLVEDGDDTFRRLPWYIESFKGEPPQIFDDCDGLQWADLVWQDEARLFLREDEARLLQEPRP